MNARHLLITLPAHPPVLARLQADPDLDITLYPEPVSTDHDGLADWPSGILRDQQILFCEGMPSKNFDELNRLQWVQSASVGYEQFIPLDLPARSIRLTNARGVLDTAMADWNIMMMIALTRDLRGMIRNQDRGIWDRDLRFHRELRGATVGFWGYGGIARETARLAKAMGVRVHVFTRSGPTSREQIHVIPGTGDPAGVFPDRVFRMPEKFDFLRSLDFLVLAIPQTPLSVGVVGEAELRALPRHAYLINPTRGPLVVESALLRALREGWIAGAALDAHFQYPMPPDHPLWRMPNVIMTPHISGDRTQHLMPRVWELFAGNLDRFRDGQPLLNEVLPADFGG